MYFQVALKTFCRTRSSCSTTSTPPPYLFFTTTPHVLDGSASKERIAGLFKSPTVSVQWFSSNRSHPFCRTDRPPQPSLLTLKDHQRPPPSRLDPPLVVTYLPTVVAPSPHHVVAHSPLFLSSIRSLPTPLVFFRSTRSTPSQLLSYFALALPK